MSKWIAEFELEDGDKMPEHMDLEYHGVKLDFHCRPIGKTYEDGLNEAWELARDIIALPTSENESLAQVRKNMFGDDALFDIIRNYSASEIIKKIKEYEEIKVGDEVGKGEIKGVVIDVGSPASMSTVWWQDGIVSGWARNSLKKTGRHFPQIEEVLKQMNESIK